MIRCRVLRGGRSDFPRRCATGNLLEQRMGFWKMAFWKLGQPRRCPYFQLGAQMPPFVGNLSARHCHWLKLCNRANFSQIEPITASAGFITNHAQVIRDL